MAKNYAELIQGINQGIPDNDQGLVSPADIRENMIDLADWANELPDIENVKGAYNASTNTPILTATPDPTFNDGAYYDVTVGGTVGFDGVNFTNGTFLNVLDKLKKKGTQWYRIPFDYSSLYNVISQQYFIDTKPVVISSGTILGTPTSLTCYIAPAGTYTLPSESVTLSGNINLFFWDFASGWTWQSFDVGVKDGSVSTSKIMPGAVTPEKLAEKYILESDKKITFESQVTYSSTVSGKTTTYNSATQILYAGNSNYNCAVSEQLLDSIVLDLSAGQQWFCIGLNGLGEGIIVSTRYNLIGDVKLITSAGALSHISVGKFSTTAIPTNSIAIKIDVSTTDIIISTTTDLITYIEWGRCAKTGLGIAYSAEKLGILNGSNVKVLDVQKKEKEYSIVVASISEKEILADSDFIFASAIENFAGIVKIKYQNLKNIIKKSLEKISFKPPITVTYSSTVSGKTTTYNSATQILYAGNSNYNCAVSEQLLDSIVLDLSAGQQWFCIGLNGLGEGIIVSTRYNLIGDVKLITSAGALSHISVGKFSTTAIPTNSIAIKIDVSTTDIIISTTTDLITYIEWGRCAKTGLGITYSAEKLGILNGSNVKVISVKANINNVEGSYVDIETVEEKSTVDLNSFLFLLGTQFTSNVARVSMQNLVAYIKKYNVFSGKKMVVYGDSITAEFGVPSGTYINKLKEKLGLQDINRRGYSGYSLGAGIYGTLASDTLLAQIIAQNPSVIVIWAGTNDYGNGTGTEIGLDNSSDISTTIGGLRYIIKYLQKYAPTCNIFVCTPVPRLNMNNVNAKGYTLKNYVDAIIKTCSQNSIPVIDLYAKSGIGYDVAESASLYLSDGLHLTDLGYDRVTSIQSSFIRNFL